MLEDVYVGVLGLGVVCWSVYRKLLDVFIVCCNYLKFLS